MAKQATSSKYPTGPAHQSEYHWKEYEILQGKIDKIGAFRFQIKNWVVVIISTAAISGYYAKLPWWVFPFYLLVVGAFWLFEMKQKGFQDAYTNRAKYLEKVLRRHNKYAFSPKRQRKYSKITDLMDLDPMSLGEALHINEMHIKRHAWWNQLMKFSHHSFYVIIGVLVLAICLAAKLRSTESPPQKVEFSNPLEVNELGSKASVSKESPTVIIRNEIALPQSTNSTGTENSGTKNGRDANSIEPDNDQELPKQQSSQATGEENENHQPGVRNLIEPGDRNVNLANEPSATDKGVNTQPPRSQNENGSDPKKKKDEVWSSDKQEEGSRDGK